MDDHHPHSDIHIDYCPVGKRGPSTDVKNHIVIWLVSHCYHFTPNYSTLLAGPVQPVRQVQFWPYHFLVALRLVGMGYTAGGSAVAPMW